MADDNQDESEKTEEPTQRRLEEALKKGQVVNSREVSNFLLLIAFAALLLWLIPMAMILIYENFKVFIISPHEIEVSETNAQSISSYIINIYAIIMIPTVLAAVAASILGNIIQHPPVFTFETIIPKLEKISLIKGLKRMFSLRSFTEFLKGVGKIALVGVVAYIVLRPIYDYVDILMTLEVLGILNYLHDVALKIMIGVLIIMAAIAIIDFLYQKYEYIKNLKMSRQDIKQEMKQSEGDPHIKARLRQIRMERVRKRMMAAVPDADVIITNPTHFSVALKYEYEKMVAPVVVAKGMDNIALKIRELAEENDIPLVENPPLARALYDAVEVDEEIPIEFYQTVADVISYVYKLKNKKAA